VLGFVYDEFWVLFARLRARPAPSEAD